MTGLEGLLEFKTGDRVTGDAAEGLIGSLGGLEGFCSTGEEMLGFWE